MTERTKEMLSDWVKLAFPAILAAIASYTALAISNAEIRAEIRSLNDKTRIHSDMIRENGLTRAAIRDVERLEREIMVRLEELQRRQAAQNDFLSRRLDALEARTGGPRLDGPLIQSR